MQNVVGNFEVGKQFDAIFVDPDVNEGPFELFLETDKAKVSRTHKVKHCVKNTIYNQTYIQKYI